MRQTVLDWLPDVGNWRIDFGTVTDVAGLVLGAAVLAFTVWVARRQIQIMNRQTEMMKEQSDSAARQEAIAKRQGEIAETQYEILQEQLAQKPQLLLDSGEQAVSDVVSGIIDGMLTQPTTVMIYLVNAGGRTAEGCTWEIGIPTNLHSYVRPYVGAKGRLLDPTSRDGQFDVVSNAFDDKLLPGSRRSAFKLEIENQVERTKEFSISWRIRHNEGIDPRHGQAWLHFKRREDKYFGVTDVRNA